MNRIVWISNVLSENKLRYFSFKGLELMQLFLDGIIDFSFVANIDFSSAPSSIFCLILASIRQLKKRFEVHTRSSLREKNGTKSVKNVNSKA
jgi:hypothetical protein